MYADQTLKQREYLKKIQNELKELERAGHCDKTIKYVDNVPKIVPKRNPKN